MEKKLLPNGNAFKRTDDRWGGTVWYLDEKGERKRKSFSGTTKQEVNKKMTDYVAAFNRELLESDVMHLQRGVKEISRREGTTAEPGREVKVGKLKSAASRRDVPLNGTAVAMIEELRKESYFGETTPLVCDHSGDFTRPVNFRKRYYKILKAAGIKRKGLHSLRHTFATQLINGQKQPDGSIKSLSPR